MIETTPQAITLAIRTFCLSIAPMRATFIRCRPDNDGEPSACFDNVARKVDRAGRTAVTGWAIWTVRCLYLEAEHHGVWCNRHGELVDVTPQPNRPKRMLFLRDDAMTYDSTSFRSNVMYPASDDPLAVEFVELGMRRSAIQIDGARGAVDALRRAVVYDSAGIALSPAGPHVGMFLISLASARVQR